MDSQNAWQNALSQLQVEMPKASYETWVKSTELINYDQDKFTVAVHNAFARDWLDNRLSSTVSRMLSGMMNKPQTVEFVVWHRENTAEKINEDEAYHDEEEDHKLDSSEPSINPKYTFDNFIVGASNRLPHAASLAVAENPAKAYNPLFLYGGVGLGKTHLLHAIGNKVRGKGLQVLYVSSEEFTNDLINSIRTHTTQAFRERYRRIDVLLIDDIQFIAGKESTQEEFFHTFNTLHGQDKQLVISSDRSPKAMVTLEERLRSRFEWGLTADIQAPDLETRIAILRSKAEKIKQNVPAEILEAIAGKVQSNIRELEGALTRVLAYSDLTNQPLTTILVNTVLSDMVPRTRSLEPRQILQMVATQYQVSTENLLSKDRSHNVALPRQVAMYLMREEAGLSLPQIGLTVGGRDHTTVMYACEKIAEQIETDDQLRKEVVQLRDTLYGRR
jgi:chromosomal replication initiator protein